MAFFVVVSSVEICHSSFTHQSCYTCDVQVCNLAWSKSANELVSTHGYSQNHINVWRYPSLTQVAKLTGHTTRVLYLVSMGGGRGGGERREGKGGRGKEGCILMEY